MKEASPQRRTTIVRIVWESRTPKSLTFLAQALSDPVDSVWQEALNGIATIGGEEAMTLLHAMLPASQANKREWIIEALSQISDKRCW